MRADLLHKATAASHANDWVDVDTATNGEAILATMCTKLTVFASLNSSFTRGLHLGACSGGG